MAPLRHGILLSLVACASASFTVPKDQPDGVYTVGHDAQGRPQHTRIGDIQHGPEDWLHGRQHGNGPRSLPGDGVHCASIIPEYTELNKAASNLGIACDTAVSSGKGDEFIASNDHKYSKVGSTVAFVCNYGDKSQHCFSYEVRDDILAIQKECKNAGGYKYHSDWKKSYGADDAAKSFC